MKQPLLLGSIITFCIFSLSRAAVAAAFLPVPYTVQAPDGVWEEPWLNACEEASLAMVDAYYEQRALDNQAARRILAVFTEKHRLFPVSLDESPYQIAHMANTFFSWRAKVVERATVEAIKKEVDHKRPVLLPFDAERVDNQNFENPKPSYHVAVVIGYDDEREEFIVHDPGTSRGEAFRYAYDELMDANASYTIQDTGEVLGGEAVFTAPQPIWSYFFDIIRRALSRLRE